MEIVAAGIVGGLVSHVVGGDSSKEEFAIDNKKYGFIVIERDSDMSLKLLPAPQDSINTPTHPIYEVDEIEVIEVNSILFKGDFYYKTPEDKNNKKYAFFENENDSKKYILLEKLDGKLRLRTDYDKKNCCIQ